MSAITLITGTRKGIGRSLAEYYLLKGHQVIGCSRKESDLSHTNYRHYQADISDPGSVKKLFSKVAEEFGHLDHLINSAAAAGMNHSLLMTPELAQEIVSTNLLGTFLVSQEAARLMVPKKFGRIVNVSSVAVPLKLEGHALYAASKAGVETMAGILAREFAEFGITVNCLGPTGVETDMLRAIPKERRLELLSRQAIPRECTMAEIHHLVDFFFSRNSDLITGQTVYFGGV